MSILDKINTNTSLILDLTNDLVDIQNDIDDLSLNKQDAVNLITGGYLTMGAGLQGVQSGLNTTINKYANLHIRGRSSGAITSASNTEILLDYNAAKRTNALLFTQAGTNITFLAAGDCQVTAQATLQRTTYSGAGALELRLLINGVATNTIVSHAPVSASADFITISLFKNYLSGIVANDVLTIGLKNSADVLTGWNFIDSTLFIEWFGLVPSP